MFRQFCILSLVVVFPAFAHGVCQNVSILPDDRSVEISEPVSLIVTHPSTQWDGRRVTKIGVDETIRAAKSRKVPVIYLVDSKKLPTYFMEDCEPSYWVHSYSGEFPIRVKSNTVISVGGNYEVCESVTKSVLFLRDWATKKTENLRLIHVLNAIFNGAAYEAGGNLIISPEDPSWSKFTGYVDFLRTTHPLVDSNRVRVSALELSTLVGDPARFIGYLTKNTLSLESIQPRYEIRATYKGSTQILRQSNVAGEPHPVLLLEYIDSVKDLQL